MISRCQEPLQIMLQTCNLTGLRLGIYDVTCLPLLGRHCSIVQIAFCTKRALWLLENLLWRTDHEKQTKTKQKADMFCMDLIIMQFAGKKCPDSSDIHIIIIPVFVIHVWH